MAAALSIETLYEVAGELPCADLGLLVILKRSPEYAVIRGRVADPKPVDAWQANQLHYFVFALHPDKDAASAPGNATALFTMRWEDDGPVNAVAITPNRAGDAAEVVNLARPGDVQTVALPQQKP